MKQKKIEIIFHQIIDDEISEEEIREWIEYELGYADSISLENSLITTEIEPVDVEVKTV